GLLQLGAAEVQTSMPAVFTYWRDFASRYVVALRILPDNHAGRTLPDVPPPPDGEFELLVSGAPPMTGAEYLTASVLKALWAAIDAAFRLELSESKVAVEEFLKQKNAAWNLVGRVHFN